MIDNTNLNNTSYKNDDNHNNNNINTIQSISIELNSSNNHDSDNHVSSLLYLDTPTFDIKSLEIKGEELATKASKKIRKANTLSERLGIMQWVRQWRKKGSTHKIGMMFDDLLPRLNAAKDDILIWLEALSEKKEQAIEQGDHQLVNMQEYIDSQSLRIDSIDELINDCLTINFDLNREMNDINSLSNFNFEVSNLKNKAKKTTSQRDNDHCKIKLNPAVWQGPKQSPKIVDDNSVDKCSNSSTNSSANTNTITNTNTTNSNVCKSSPLMKTNVIDKSPSNNDYNNNNSNNHNDYYDSHDNNDVNVITTVGIDDGIINLSMKPSISVQSLKLIQNNTNTNTNSNGKLSSSSPSSTSSSPSPSPPPSQNSTPTIDIKKKLFNSISNGNVTSNYNNNNDSNSNSNSSTRRKSVSSADILEHSSLLIDDIDQQEIQAKYTRCQSIKDEVNQCLINLRSLREAESQALKRAKKIKEELNGMCDIAKESPSKKHIKEEPHITHLNATALMLPSYCGVNTNDNSIQASESCQSASSGSVLSAFDLNYMVIECLDDIKILMQEEEKAKEKLAVVMGILSNLEDIKHQLATLDKSFSRKNSFTDTP